MFPPRLIIIGAQKAGTTSLSEALSSHPEISLGRTKEPDFYTRHWARGLRWYRENYEGEDVPWLLDASTSYTAGFTDSGSGRMFPVAQRIRATVPDAKLVYILRDPVDRAYSAYWHRKRFGAEALSLTEAVTRGSIYVRQGKYVDHLEGFLEHFNRGDILILDFDVLKTNERSVLESVAEFLGISADEFERTKRKTLKNKGFQFSGVARIGMRLAGSEKRFRSTIRMARKWMPSILSDWGGRVLTRKIPKLSALERYRIAGYFKSDIERLEVLLGRKFSHWSKSDTPQTMNHPGKSGDSVS